MDFARTLLWICRSCGVDMEDKSTKEAVHLFGAGNMAEKLKKYFNIEVTQDDILPKYMCRKCYKRLEITHEFARLAKRTERFLKTYTSPAYVTKLSQNTSSDLPNRFQNEFSSFVHSLDKCYSSVNRRHSEPNSAPTKRHNSASNARDVGNILQEKRQNLKTALAASKAVTSSLPRIKVKSESALRTPATNMNNISQQTLNSMSTTVFSPILTNMYDAPSPPLQHNLSNITAENNSAISFGTPQQDLSNLTAETNSAFRSFDTSSHQQGHDFTKLGHVVRDIDLLTLILKALKWPYTNENIHVQINLLKEASFREVMNNQNLLQDTDLMQILTTILSPDLLQKLKNPQPTHQSISPAFAPIKLPADLSICLVTEGVHDTQDSLKMSKHNRQEARRRKHKASTRELQYCSTPIEILSDDESIQMFEVNVDPNLYLNMYSESFENSNTSDATKKVRNSESRKKNLLTFKINKSPGKKETTKRKAQRVVNVEPKKANLKSKIETPSESNCEKHADCLDMSSEMKTKPQEKNLVEELSGDEEAWAEFKVIDSPNISAENDLTLVSGTVDTSHVKDEPENGHASQTTTIKTENEYRAEISTICDAVPNIKVKIEKTETVDEAPENPEFQKEPSSCEEMPPLKIEISPDKCQPKKIRPKSVESTNAKETVSTKKDTLEKSKIAKTAAPRKSLRRSTPVAKSHSKSARATRSSTTASTPVQTAMSLRNSNARRRICKQCGQSFILLKDFLNHRKSHIEM